MSHRARLGWLVSLVLLGAVLAGAPAWTQSPSSPPAGGPADDSRAPTGAPARGWAYVTGFGSGAVYVVDLDGARLVRVVPVDDTHATAGVCVTSDGRRLVVVDGDARARVRVFDALTGGVTAMTRFEGRRRGAEGNWAARMSGDDAWVFIETQAGTRVFDLRTRRVLEGVLSLPPLPGLHVVGGDRRRMLAVGQRTGLAFTASLPARVRVTARASLPLSGVADAVAARDGSRMLVVAPVAPMGRLALPRPARPAPSGAPSAAPAASPTPNPALREGPWRMVSWTPGTAAVREVDLVRRLDVEKTSAAGPPRLALSPDGRQLALVYGRQAWILDASDLRMRWEIHPPGRVDGAAFTADGAHLLTVLGQQLLCVRLANRSYQLMLPGQMHLPGAVLVVAAPRPPVAP